MDCDIENIMKQLKNGEIDIFSALSIAAKQHNTTDLGFAKIDHDRKSRCGFPEFIYGAGKNLKQFSEIIPAILKRKNPVLVTRLDASTGKKLCAKFPKAEYDELARTLVIRQKKSGKKPSGNILVITAGTSDLGVALEAKYTAELCGCGVEVISDVGVAGIHRLFAEADRLRRADVVIVVAGMEGALPSAVGGLVSCPVIAVPTSIGYGASLNGFTALFCMLSSCASGITTVNIDNGFGAACAAERIVNSKS